MKECSVKTQVLKAILDVVLSIPDDTEVSEVRSAGKWKVRKFKEGYENYYEATCSVCGFHHKDIIRGNGELYKASFCPSCGADMDMIHGYILEEDDNND